MVRYDLVVVTIGFDGRRLLSHLSHNEDTSVEDTHMDDSKNFYTGCGGWGWDLRLCPFLLVVPPNDPDMLTEIRCFSGNEPIFDVSNGDNRTISLLALNVVYWLQVCPSPSLWAFWRVDDLPNNHVTFSQRCDDPSEEIMSLWRSHILKEDLP